MEQIQRGFSKKTIFVHQDLHWNGYNQVLYRTAHTQKAIKI
jgi:hypothetical protein